MHMFSDPHTFLIAIFGHIQNSTNHFATFSFLFHALPEEGVGGQFSIYIYWLFQHTWFNLHVFTSNLYYFEKRVYKAKSSVMLGCRRLQRGREGIRELLRVVSCNSLPLSCGGQCWFWWWPTKHSISYHTWWQLWLLVWLPTTCVLVIKLQMKSDC